MVSKNIKSNSAPLSNCQNTHLLLFMGLPCLIIHYIYHRCGIGLFCDLLYVILVCESLILYNFSEIKGTLNQLPDRHWLSSTGSSVNCIIIKGLATSPGSSVEIFFSFWHSESTKHDLCWTYNMYASKKKKERRKKKCLCPY